MKALVGAFNQEKALVGALSVIVQLHRLIDLRHYSSSCAGSRASPSRCRWVWWAGCRGLPAPRAAPPPAQPAHVSWALHRIVCMWIFVFRIFIRNNRRERKYCGLWVENFCQIKRIIDLHKLPYYIVLDVHSSIVSNMEFIVHSWQRYTYEPNAVCWSISPPKCHFS